MVVKPRDPNKIKGFDPESDSLLLNPKPFLEKLKGQHVSMRIMSGSMLEGTLHEVSDMCDVTLKNWKELVFGKEARHGETLKVFRDNIMYVRGPKPGEAQAAAAKTQEEAPAAPAASEP